MPSGVVKFWNAERGFGFIGRENGDDIFCHINSLADEEVELLRVGQPVQFEEGVSKRDGRPEAVNVVLAKD